MYFPHGFSSFRKEESPEGEVVGKTIRRSMTHKQSFLLFNSFSIKRLSNSKKTMCLKSLLADILCCFQRMVLLFSAYGMYKSTLPIVVNSTGKNNIIKNNKESSTTTNYIICREIAVAAAGVEVVVFIFAGTMLYAVCGISNNLPLPRPPLSGRYNASHTN